MNESYCGTDATYTSYVRAGVGEIEKQKKKPCGMEEYVQHCTNDRANEMMCVYVCATDM